MLGTAGASHYLPFFSCTRVRMALPVHVCRMVLCKQYHEPCMHRALQAHKRPHVLLVPRGGLHGRYFHWGHAVCGWLRQARPASKQALKQGDLLPAQTKFQQSHRNYA